MTFLFASFLKLCDCMISKGECLTWCDRQTAWGLENRDWKKKQANPRDSLFHLLLLHPCAETVDTLFVPQLLLLGKGFIFRAAALRWKRTKGSSGPFPHVSPPLPLPPCIWGVTRGACCLCTCTPILFLSPSAIYTALRHLDSVFHDLQRGRASQTITVQGWVQNTHGLLRVGRRSWL